MAGQGTVAGQGGIAGQDPARQGALQHFIATHLDAADKKLRGIDDGCEDAQLAWYLVGEAARTQN